MEKTWEYTFVSEERTCQTERMRESVEWKHEGRRIGVADCYCDRLILSAGPSACSSVLIHSAALDAFFRGMTSTCFSVVCTGSIQNYPPDSLVQPRARRVQ